MGKSGGSGGGKKGGNQAQSAPQQFTNQYASNLMNQDQSGYQAQHAGQSSVPYTNQYESSLMQPGQQQGTQNLAGVQSNIGIDTGSQTQTDTPEKIQDKITQLDILKQQLVDQLNQTGINDL